LHGKIQSVNSKGRRRKKEKKKKIFSPLKFGRYERVSMFTFSGRGEPIREPEQLCDLM
tara:strand:+ start:478 stop:651 length:174 start_codon:yes stop_codon:yes gene_type:complete